MTSYSEEDIYTAFLDTHSIPNTRRAYQNDLCKLRDFLQRKGIPSCLKATPSDLASFITEQIKKYSAGYVIHIKTTVRSFYEYLCVCELINRNPTSVFSSIRIRQPVRYPRALVIEQRNVLLKSLRYRTYADLKTSVAVLLGLHQGLRVSEMTGLKWDSVDFENNSLHLIRKGNKEHIMPMTRTMSTALYQLRCEVIAKYGFFQKQYVFPRPGSSISIDKSMFGSTLQRFVKKAAEKAGLNCPISIHVLRHSFATHLIESGIDILTVSYLMGHSSIRTTQVYIRENSEKTARELKRAFSNETVNK
jgi:site-specific recombinase XerD